MFSNPRGEWQFEGRWQPPELPERPVAALIQQNAFAGARPDAWTAGARWERERDIPKELLFRASEAL